MGFPMFGTYPSGGALKTTAVPNPSHRIPRCQVLRTLAAVAFSWHTVFFGGSSWAGRVGFWVVSSGARLPSQPGVGRAVHLCPDFTNHSWASEEESYPGSPGLGSCVCNRVFGAGFTAYSELLSVIPAFCGATFGAVLLRVPYDPEPRLQELPGSNGCCNPRPPARGRADC